MNEERFAKEMKKIQSVISRALQKANTLTAVADGGKMNPEKLQLTLEETAYFFEAATLHLRALCETQMPGIGGYGRRDGLEFQLPSGHIEIAGAGWVHTVSYTHLRKRSDAVCAYRNHAAAQYLCAGSERGRRAASSRTSSFSCFSAIGMAGNPSVPHSSTPPIPAQNGVAGKQPDSHSAPARDKMCIRDRHCAVHQWL